MFSVETCIYATRSSASPRTGSHSTGWTSWEEQFGQTWRPCEVVIRDMGGRLPSRTRAENGATPPLEVRLTEPDGPGAPPPASSVLAVPGTASAVFLGWELSRP